PARPQDVARHRPDAAHVRSNGHPHRGGADARGHGRVVLVQPELLMRLERMFPATRTVMTTATRFRIAATLAGTAALAAALNIAATAAAPRFYDDDPIWQDRDTQDASAMKPLEVDLVVDLATNLLGERAPVAGRAKNVNTVDEVPDSSWYTNRIGARQ